jgi:hypothetical protein
MNRLQTLICVVLSVKLHAGNTNITIGGTNLCVPRLSDVNDETMRGVARGGE